MPLKMVIKIDQQHNLNSAPCCRSPYFFSRFLSLDTLVKNQFQHFAFSSLDLLHHLHFHPFLFILHPQIFQFGEYLSGAYVEQNLEQCDALAGFFGIYGLAWLHFRFASTLSYYYTTLSTTYFVGWKLWLTWIQWLFIFYWTRIYWKFEWLNVNLIDNFLMCAN